MRILSRSPGTSCRSSGLPARDRALGLGLASALALAVSAASAQPAPRPAQAQPPAAQPAPGAARPAQPGAAQPAQPGAAQPAAPGAAQPAQPGAPPAQPGAAQPVPEPAQAAPAPPPGAAEPAEPPEEEPLMPQVTPPPTTPVSPARPQVAAKPEPARPAATGEIGARPSDVYAEDWWTHARPTFEIHGYYRVRAELFHQFALGRRDLPGQQIWPQPPDKHYARLDGTIAEVRLCGDAALNPEDLEACDNNTNAGANMRFRLNPELHVSDNLRVLAQIDMLDNVVLGSTPEGYANRPVSSFEVSAESGARGGDTGYEVVSRGGYAPLGVFSGTQWAPRSGVNALADSVAVKRVWGEYLTPIGLLRFGRMPHHWGLGMLYNSGDGHDSDYQTTVDRLMLVTGIKKYDIYFSAAWDFANEGATSASLGELEGQPYDLGQQDDVDQYVLVAVRRKNPELQKLELAQGNVVMNGGIHFAYRTQALANDAGAPAESDPDTHASLGQAPDNVRQGYVRREAEMFIPDVWFQLLYKKFRFELEAAMIWGSIENTLTAGSNYQNLFDPEDHGWGIRQFGMATQTEFRAIEDRLRVHFGFGYASGDDDVASLVPQGDGLQPQLTSDRTYSTFRFHPDYRVDLILNRHILNRVQGAYYFRPGVDYDFARDKNGQRLGGGAAVIWTRAAEFVQTPGHARDLGLELNFQLYFQSKDGSLNDDPDRMGGFFTSLQYGVMFPLGGLGYLPGEEAEYADATGGAELDTETAQTVRWYLGVLF